MTKRQIKNAIKEWLAFGGREDKCPFGTIGWRVYGACEFCEIIFPRCKKTPHLCPCQRYTRKHVIRKARQLLEDL